jgi:hypothetical protein
VFVSRISIELTILYSRIKMTLKIEIDFSDRTRLKINLLKKTKKMDSKRQSYVCLKKGIKVKMSTKVPHGRLRLVDMVVGA